MPHTLLLGPSEKCGKVSRYNSGSFSKRNDDDEKPIIIGVAGGSGSGKTTVSQAIYREFSGSPITIIEQDYYYKNQPELPIEERKKQNYDHPSAYDNDLLLNHINLLLARKAVDIPQYDYTNYMRHSETKYQEPVDVIIIEGILALYDERIRNLMDIKLFVDTDADLRFIRRMLRDIQERGRSVESVVKQYTEQVRPMHNQFVEPTKRHAHIIIPCDEQNNVAIDVLIAKISTVLRERIDLS